MTPPQLAFLFEAQVHVAAPIEMGPGPNGAHRVIPITGGIVTGPRINGIVLPGGADWQWIRPDGAAEIEARYIIETNDGARINVVNRGLRHGPPAVLQRLAAGLPVDRAEYYFRTTPVFQTAAPRYEWLTKSVFVATGERHPNHVLIQFWEVQ
jgi:hypothetical protein